MPGKYNYDHVIMEPYNYILVQGGKQFRNKLMLAFNYWFELPDDQMNLVKDMVELLHNSSLLIDDIEDNSELRRGIPVAHKVYGLGMTLNSGNFCYFLALEKLLQGCPAEKAREAASTFVDCVLDLHRGQAMDLYWRDHMICPSEEDYLEMISRKTGGLFGLGIKIMQLLSDKKFDNNFTELMVRLGEFFQVRDDYANLVLKEYEESKTFAEDLTEGKFSLPIIYCIKKKPDDRTLLDILSQRTTDINVKKMFIKKMESMGALEYTLNKIRELDKECTRLINEIGYNEPLDRVLDILRKV